MKRGLFLRFFAIGLDENEEGCDGERLESGKTKGGGKMED